jgi:hypothetical protein
MKRFILVYLFFHSIFVYPQSSATKEVINRMIKANENLRTAKFTIHTEERLIDGKFEIKEGLVKFQRKPEQINFVAIQPNAGTKIIWKEGWNDNKMHVSPASFPFVSFSTKINGSIARKDAHHSIRNLGFDYLTGLLMYYQKIFGEKFYQSMMITDTVEWDNHSCIVVKYDNKDYREINYTVKKNENIMDIAEKHHLNDYSILMLNPAIDDFDDVKEGQVIKIPSFYSRSIEFYIDRSTWLPLRQLISDGKGLYEKYEMKSFFLNPVFNPSDFVPD